MRKMFVKPESDEAVIYKKNTLELERMWVTPFTLFCYDTACKYWHYAQIEPWSNWVLPNTTDAKNFMLVIYCHVNFYNQN